MPGLFDDIVPAASGGGARQRAGLFDDIAPPPKREIGALEAGARGAGSTFAEQGNLLGLAVSAPAVLADAVANLFRARPSTSAQDFMFRNVVDPTRDAVNFYKPGDDEVMGAGATAANVAGRLAGMIPSMVASGGSSAAPVFTQALAPMAPRALQVIPGIVSTAASGAVAAQPSFAQPATATRAQDLLEAGVDMPTVAKASASNWLAYTAMGALPIAVPGKELTRVTTGAGMGAATSSAQRAAEKQILGEKFEKLAQDPFGAAELGMDGGISGAMALILGSRGAGAARAAQRPSTPPEGAAPKTDLQLEPMDESVPPPAQPDAASYDPKVELQRIAEALFPMPEGAPAVPDMKLVDTSAPTRANPRPVRSPQDAAAVNDALFRLQDVEDTRPMMSPDFGTTEPGVTGAEKADILAQRAARQASRAVETPDVVAVDGQGRAIPLDATGRPEDQGTIAGLLQNQLAARARQEAEARRAMDVADAQRQRKQGAQDDAALQGETRDLRDARAGGTTTPEGTAATAPQTFAFFRAKKVNGQLSGEQVEIVQRGVSMKDAKGKDVEATVVRFLDREGQPEMPVPAKEVSELSRPANPRFEQDIAATAYGPRQGVGTGPDQPAPRVAAQRITTQPSPDFIPGEGSNMPPRDSQPSPRAARNRDVSDLAFDRVQSRPAGEPAGRQTQPAQRLALPGERRADAQAAPRNAEVPTAAESRPGGADATIAGAAADQQPRLFDQQPAQQPAPKPGGGKREEVARADAEDPGGAIGLAQDKVRAALDGREDVRQVGDDSAYRAEQDARYVAELDAYAAERGIDTSGKTPEQINAELDRMDAEQAAREESVPVEYADEVLLLGKASEVDSDAVAGLVKQLDDEVITEGQFFDALRGIINGKGEAGQGERAAGGGEADGAVARAEAGADARSEGVGEGQGAVRAENSQQQRPGADESRPDFSLEQPSEADLRLRADAERRAADERGRVEAAPEPGEFVLSGSKRAADQAAARGQQELGGTQLYGGLPLDAMAKHVKEAFGWAVGKDWARSAADFNDIIKGGKDRIPHVGGNPVARFLRYFLESSSADMRAVLKRTGDSATAKWVVDQFHTEAGSDRVTGETFRSAVDAFVNKKLLAMEDAMGGVMKMEKSAREQSLAQIVNLVRNPQNIRRGTTVGDAAFAIRGLLDDTLKYMREAGVEIGEVRNGYFPREFDSSIIMRDPEGFRKAVAQAYREGGMPPKDAAASADVLHDSLIYGDGSGLYSSAGGNPQASFLKGRVFGKNVESPSHPLHKFLVNDPAVSLPIYFQRAARRAEIARRFGDGFSKWEDYKDKNGTLQSGMVSKIKEEGGADAVRSLAEYVGLAAGVRNPHSSNFGVRGASMLRTWGSLMFLEKATLSSLSEFIVPAMRSGNAMDAARTLKNTLAELFTKTAGTAERKAMAEDLGILASSVSDTFNAARFSGGEPVSLAESRILDKYFRRTGLTQWTEATRVAAADMSRVFLRRVAKQYGEGGKLAKRHLSELGIAPEKQAEFVKWLLAQNDGLPTAQHLAGGGEQAETFRRAARRFVSQGIMNPDATLRPAYMRTPFGSLIGQLQSFNYAFYENVLKRNARLAKEAVTGEGYTNAERAELLMPTMMIPMLWAASYAIGETRDALLGNQERRKEETGGDKFIKAVSRGTPVAPLDPFINYMNSAKYQRGAADFVAGPVLGTAARGLDSARNAVANNNANTNTAERNVAKNVYDLLVEPTVNLALSSTPVAPLSAVATQAAGSGRVREAVVSAVAGEKKKPASGMRGESWKSYMEKRQ